MKNKHLYITTGIFALIILFFSVGYSNQYGAVYGVCGAPDDLAVNACGTGGCHNFVPIKDSNTLAITLLDASNNQVVNSYHVNRKYIVRVELTRASLKACGFESTVETKSGNIHVGTMAGHYKSQLTAFNKNYMTHISSSKVSPGYGKWEYYWTSPATSQGDIVIYAAGNDANGDGSNYGDSIFVSQKTYPFLDASGVQNAVENQAQVNIYPNPAHDRITIHYHMDQAAPVSAGIFDVSGQYVRSAANETGHPGTNAIVASISDLPAGLYYLKIQTGTETTTRKILKD